MRVYSERALDNRFAQAFDKGAVEYEMDDYWRVYPKKERNEIGFEKARREFFRYLFSARELAERMSQLKNYYGMRGDEQFTKEHLDYARAHYIKDIGLDNHMRKFFAAITPEKEEMFLKLINTAGI